MSNPTPNPQPPTPDRIVIGEITAPHGIHGQVRVTMLTDFPERWRALKQVTLVPPEETRPAPGAPRRPPSGPQVYAVQGVKVLGGARTKRRGRIADPGDLHTGPWGGQIHQVLLQLEGVDSPEAASLLRGYSIEVPAAEAWPLPPGTFYTYQILNLPLVTAAGTSIGILTEVLTTGSNDVYVVKTPGGKELLVPAIREIVEEINPAGGYIRIKDPAAWGDTEEA